MRDPANHPPARHKRKREGLDSRAESQPEAQNGGKGRAILKFSDTIVR
jgi:hypothetical protein